ncbi:MAG TPA: PDZ domain-containing protein, partial [Burkholderiales bacterium]|nr:PDZ domain-containing protein [Burkholderiales bacterium]
IGFAVPAVMARAVMAQLIKFGEVRRGRLGISMQDVTGGEGAQIAEVVAGSPAAAAGLQKGDVVTALNGRPVRGSAELRARLGVVPAGETVELQVRRGAETRLIKARIAELESRQAAGGQAVAELGGAMLANGQAGRTRGVVVSTVEAGSPAFGHGLRSGDLIVGVNQRRVTSVGELANVLRSSERVTLNVLRGEHQLAVPVR